MTHLQWRKEALLEAIFIEIEEGVVMVENIKRLEELVEIIHKQGSKVPESVKKAYCDVAVDCTARCLAQKRDAKEAFIDAMRSIWLRRIMPLCDEVSCLITRELLDSCKKLWRLYTEGEACESLTEENTRNEALVSLRKVVSELHPDPAYGYDRRDMYMGEVESSEDFDEGEPMAEGREIEVNTNSEAVDQGQESFSDTELESQTSGESEAEVSPRQSMTISSASVDRALRKLTISTIQLVNALEEEAPSNVYNETVTELENAVARLSATYTGPKLSFMEQKRTAHTYEGKDATDGSDEEMRDDGERNNTSELKRSVVSPLERNQSSASEMRTRLSWTTAEPLAVLKGPEKYADTDMVKTACGSKTPLMDDDSQDKFRVEMRREERHP